MSTNIEIKWDDDDFLVEEEIVVPTKPIAKTIIRSTEPQSTRKCLGDFAVQLGGGVAMGGGTVHASDERTADDTTDYKGIQKKAFKSYNKHINKRDKILKQQEEMLAKVGLTKLSRK